MNRHFLLCPTTGLFLWTTIVTSLAAETNDKFVIVSSKSADVIRDNKVVLKAKKGQRFKFIHEQDGWIGISWKGDSAESSGWIAARDVRRDASQDASAIQAWISPAGSHPSKESLKSLINRACTSTSKAAIASCLKALKSDSQNALLYYLLTDGYMGSIRYKEAVTTLRKGNTQTHAYQYVMESGLEQFLDPLLHLEPVRRMAVALTRRARKLLPKDGIALLKSLRIMARKIARAKPYSTVNLQLGMGILAIADKTMVKLSSRLDENTASAIEKMEAADQKWKSSVQQELLLKGSEEIGISMAYLQNAGLSRAAIAQFMTYAPAQAMEEAITKNSKPKKEERKPEVLKKPKKPEKKEPGVRKGFYRNVRNYDFLSAMLLEAIEDDEEAPEPTRKRDLEPEPKKPEVNQEMAEFFAQQETDFLKTIRRPAHLVRIKRAKEFLIAAITGGKLFDRLLFPRTRPDKEERARWDQACDKGQKERAEIIRRLTTQMP